MKKDPNRLSGKCIKTQADKQPCEKTAELLNKGHLMRHPEGSVIFGQTTCERKII